jgi:hypothetical protein
MLPIAFLAIAILAAGAVAFGGRPAWAQYPFGLDIIVWTRQLQWLLIGMSLAGCLGVVALVAGGKRRVWWLVGLAPVMALFINHLFSNPLRGFIVFAEPAFVSAGQATDLPDDDWVLGLELNGKFFAYPYSRLYSVPVVVQDEHDKRLLLIWNPFANHALARLLTRELHARDLDLASMPANATLVYNTKHGQFINGITGLTLQGEKPAAIGSEVPVEKTTWTQWRTAHPDTQVMLPPPNARPGVPGKPLRPELPLPAPEANAVQVNPDTRVIIIPTTRPIAILSEYLTERPANVASPDLPELVFRDARTGKVRAFSRVIDDLKPRFTFNTNARRPGVFMIDADTNSGWNADGQAVDGPLAKQNRTLTPLPVLEGCYWGVMKTWMPDLFLVDPDYKPSLLSGYVYFDQNDNGERRSEPGIPDVSIELTGVNDLGVTVYEVTTTDASGLYRFSDLRPGKYKLVEMQPAKYKDGKDTIGSLGGKVANDTFSDIILTAGAKGTEYNFGELTKP